MELEERIRIIESVSVRITALGLLLFALLALLFFGLYELISFVVHVFGSL
jgi:hypothetical protein